MKTDERLRARAMRASGMSVRDIERALGVSRSSVSTWVRDVQLEPDAYEKLVARAGVRRLAAAERQVERARERRRALQECGAAFARTRDPLYVAGCMLYWAEGDKCRNQLRISNADPELLRLFVRFLRVCFGIEDELITVSCNLFADHARRQREIEDYWLNCLALPRSSLRKTTVNRYSRSSLRKRVNKLPYGTCKIVVSRQAFVQAIYGSIQEFAGFQRPEWIEM